jgi:hypothetical protein
MEKWNPSEPYAGGTIIQIVFGPGMCSEDEQTSIEMKKVGPTEIVGNKKGDPVLELPEEKEEKNFLKLSKGNEGV